MAGCYCSTRRSGRESATSFTPSLATFTSSRALDTLDEQIRGYIPLVENLAEQYVGWNGAEQDDLVQEGLIDVWRALRNGSAPASQYIESRMRRYCNWLGRRYPVDYEDMLSFDQLEGTRHEPVAE